jgi:hypothetical protein
MIQGVHAETVVFMDFDRATELVRATGLPWLGRPGPMSTREVNLNADASRPFRGPPRPAPGTQRQRQRQNGRLQRPARTP